MGGAFLMVDRLHTSPSDVLDHPGDPVTDAQTEAQVVESAKQIVTAAGLRTKTAGYLLMSCKERDDPPYQGAIYLTFALPAETRADTYFPTITAALIARGWSEGLPPNNRTFGKTLSRDAVTAIIYRDNDDENLGVMRLYGQCRNMNDHRRDATGWIDITGQFQPIG
ncbi:hypothetical protein [Mycobacterium lacus]|uniref:hypothetical protein n=1 Tax=Mycobacterium lacus TaxID=169765 RepID=UPI001E4A8D27|nr:hypothetical protein [Mycobacterium lacus]